MHLKSLSIKGFKSFAKKVDLAFEPGITMVVGPNGSGKSNITDAIQWVLGEQSPSTLRGSAMQDVIFAGSLNSKALGLAEVTLVLDNSNKDLDLDFSEVSITRRLLRSGENFYFINSTPCRLLDIYELLHDSGLGRQTHSIIGQGKLDEIVNSKPEEKRVLLEEAAGVLKYKKRKERAARKLVSTQENLNRIKDIHKEVEQQIKPLEQQVSKASTFNKLTKELGDMEIALLVKKISQLKTRWEGITNKEGGLSSKLQPLQAQLDDLNKTITADEEAYQKQALRANEKQGLKDRLNSLTSQLEKIFSLQQQKNESSKRSSLDIKEQHGRLENQLTFKEAQSENLKKQISDVQTEINRSLKAIAAKRKESEQLQAALGGNSLRDEQEILENLNEKLKDLERTNLSKANDLIFVKKDIEKETSRTASLKGTVSLKQKEVAVCQDNLEQNIRQTERQEQVLKERQNKCEELKKELKTLDNSCIFTSGGCVLKDDYSASKDSLLSLRKELEQKAKNLNSLNKEIERLHARKVAVKSSIDIEKEDIEITRQKINTLKEARSGLEAELKFASTTLEQEISALEASENSLKSAQELKAKLIEERAALDEQLSLLTKKKISVEKNIGLFQESGKKTEEEKQLINLALTELNLSNKALSQQMLALRKQETDIENEIAELKAERKKYVARLSVNEKSAILVGRLLPSIGLLVEASSRLTEKYKEEITAAPADSLEELKALRNQEKELSCNLRELEEQKQQLAVEKSALKTSLDELADRIIQEHNLAIETAIKDYGNIEASSKRINEIRQELNAIGPVNAVAEEQFKQLSERREFLSKQVDDLLRSKISINKIIRAIDNKMRERLLETFEEVRLHFKQMFAQLFPGGQAELILTGDNIFDSGLDIQAQPYGKSLKKLSLLSGGETALTALALLFAVYHTRPSPFYVLDEVEAALDDINLQRFIRLLKDMRTKTQFITITHQRRTMEVADCLYGVSMQADGISKIISQKITDVYKESSTAKQEISAG